MSTSASSTAPAGLPPSRWRVRRPSWSAAPGRSPRSWDPTDFAQTWLPPATWVSSRRRSRPCSTIPNDVSGWVEPAASGSRRSSAGGRRRSPPRRPTRELSPHVQPKDRPLLTVDFHRLGLRPGDRVLDMGCGAGRHAFEMYRRGADVIAFDQDADELSGVSELFAAMREEG